MNDEINNYLSADEKQKIEALWKEVNAPLPPEPGTELPWGGANIRLNVAKGTKAIVGIAKILSASVKVATHTGSLEDLATLLKSIPKLFVDTLDAFLQRLTPLQYATYLVLGMHVDDGLDDKALFQKVEEFAEEAKKKNFAWFRGLDPKGINEELKRYKPAGTLKDVIAELVKEKLVRVHKGKYFFVSRHFTWNDEIDSEK